MRKKERKNERKKERKIVRIRSTLPENEEM
jgi:hypothetical protein